MKGVEPIGTAPADVRTGLAAFCEAFALDREELMRLRAIGAQFFEQLAGTLNGWGVPLSVRSLFAEIETVEPTLEKFAHGLGLGVRFERAIATILLDRATSSEFLGRIFGAHGGWTEGQPPTSLELATLSGSLGKAVSATIQPAFGALLGDNAVPLPAFVNDPQVKSPVFTEDRALVLRALVETGGRSGAIILMLPLAPLVAARSRLKVAEDVQPPRAAEHEAMLNRLGEVEIELSAICARLDMDIGAIGRLKPGSVVPLGIQIAPEARLLLTARLCAEGVALGQGLVVDDRGWRRILIGRPNGSGNSSEPAEVKSS